MEIFEFTFQVFETLINWVNQLYNLFSYSIEIGGNSYPLWSILGISGIAIIVIIKLIRSIL